LTFKNILTMVDSKSLNEIINIEFYNNMLQFKKELSNSDIKTISNKIAKFKNNPAEKTLKYILLLAVWNADLAIDISRKKGVFRYKAWGFRNNEALFILKEIKRSFNILKYSDETKKYIESKINLSWLYDFYKDSEEKIKKYILNHYSNRKKLKIQGCIVEEALFKELLVFADILFYQKRHLDISGKYDDLYCYSNEEITESISYIILLCNDILTTNNNATFVVPSVVKSEDIKKIILLGCKINKLEEWELCIDYFKYQVKFCDRTYTIFSSDASFEKSIRLGYVNSMMQSGIFYEKNINSLSNALSLAKIADLFNNCDELNFISETGEGKLARYVTALPEKILAKLYEEPYKLYQEETLDLGHFSKEFVMPPIDLLCKKITENCTLQDVILFKRFFVVLDLLCEKNIFKQRNDDKIINSLIPYYRTEQLIKIIGTLMSSEIKAQELLSLFTYKENTKLDLQYTPFISHKNGVFAPIGLIVKSNLLRNCIAYSYFLKNQIVNQEDKEYLVLQCEEIFKNNCPSYHVFTNQKFTYKTQKGEIDVLVITDNSILVVECKAPLEPTSNFEMRASYDHICKAAKQLSISEKAFSDDSFRTDYLRSLGIEEKSRNIYTCVLMGNRLFNGYTIDSHPVRYIYELDMVLTNGKINSPIGSWCVWKNDDYNENDLIKFISPDNDLIKANFNAMKLYKPLMHIKGKKIEFESYLFNTIKAIENYDKYFKIINRDWKIFEDIKNNVSNFHDK